MTVVVIGILVLILVFVLLIWACIYMDKKEALNALKAEQDALKTEQEHKAQLLKQVDELDCTIPDLLKSYFPVYKVAMFEKIAEAEIETTWFCEDSIELITYTIDQYYLLLRKDKFESIIRTTLHSTWWTCTIESMKERLTELVEHSTEAVTVEQLIVSELVNTTSNTVISRIKEIVNRENSLAADEFYTFKHAHPEAYQIARQTEAIKVQTGEIRHQAHSVQSELRSVQSELASIEREQRNLQSTVGMGMAVMMMNSRR